MICKQHAFSPFSFPVFDFSAVLAHFEGGVLIFVRMPSCLNRTALIHGLFRA